jgi:REP-associated tyrosine transposase
LSHAYAKIYAHVVFSTKERRKLISAEMQPRLWAYIGGIARNEGIPLLAAGGMEDHIHLLFCLPPTIPLSKAMVMFKANSSRWMSGYTKNFAWQGGYGAFSVSESNLPAVEEYIRNQEEHHRKLSSEEEFRLLLEKHGMEYIEDDD